MAAKKKYARFTLKALADAKCQEIVNDKLEEWNGRATSYAEPVKNGKHWYVPVLAGFEQYFKGMKLYSID